MSTSSENPLISRILSPNIGHPAFVQKGHPEFTLIVEVNTVWTLFSGKPLLMTEDLLNEKFFLEPIDKSEFLVANVTSAKKLSPKRIEDYLRQNSRNKWLYEYYELTAVIDDKSVSKVNFENKRFKLFNIIYGAKKNSHALSLIDYHWNDFKFVQISDTHVGRHWDKLEEEFKKLFKPLEHSHNINSLEKDKTFYNAYDSSLNSFTDNYISPNRCLIDFVKKANRLAEQQNLDCIIITGDIIDFASDDVIKLGLTGEAENWRLFIDILLGNIANSEELKVPIITVLGNHDYRPGSFRLIWFGMKNVGINRQLQNIYFQRVGETRRLKYAIEDAMSMFVRDKNNASLKYYANNISPFFNFMYTFNKTHFVALDTGNESFTYSGNFFGPRIFNMIRTITHGTMINGFEKRQIEFLKSSLKQFRKGDNLMLLFHGPLFNASPSVINRYARTNKKPLIRIPKINEDDPTSLIEKKAVRFEYMLIKRGLNNESVFKNPLIIMDLCLKNSFNVVTFSGHRHVNMEYTLDRRTRTVSFNSFKNELAHYPFYQHNNPIFLITTSLGQIDYTDVFRDLPSFRHVTIADNKVASIKSVQLNPKPYDVVKPHVNLFRKKYSRFSKDRKVKYDLSVKLEKSEQIAHKIVIHTLTLKFKSRYVLKLKDVKLPIELLNPGKTRMEETKIFYEKEEPYSQPVAVKLMRFKLSGDTLKCHIGKLRKSVKLYTPSIEMYFESFEKENGKLKSLGIVHYPLTIRL